MHPNLGIQSSSQIPLLIILKNAEMLWTSIFLNDLLYQLRLNKTLYGQGKVGEKSTIILLLGSFSKQFFIAWKFYLSCRSMAAHFMPYQLKDFIFRVLWLRNMQRATWFH